MKLSEIFSQLTYGELKQLNVGGYELGSIESKDYREIVNHINLALSSLYTKFPLKESSLLLRTKKGRINYELSNQYALTVNPVDGHIVDSLTNPFTSDILRIGKVYGVSGLELPVNDPAADFPVMLSSYNTLRLPWVASDEYVDGTELMVEYRAKPAWIAVPNPATNLDLTKDVPIPDMFMEPLLVYVEYRIHKAKGGQDGLAQAAMAKQNYEAMCAELLAQNVLNSSNAVTNTKLELNGWNI